MKRIFFIILIIVSFLSINVSAIEIETNENIDNYLSNFSYEKIHELQSKAGNNFDDWFILSILRSGEDIDINLYKGLLRHYINDNYQTNGFLSKNLMTEWHRIIMLSAAIGINPREVVINDLTYDLLFDGIFNVKANEALEKQGINSFVFALLALDSYSFKEIKSNELHSRKSLIEGILSYEIEGGGFAYSKAEPDIDMTALVVQALSEYYNSLYIYNVYNKIQDKIVETSVKDVIDRALTIFSSLQKEDGDFESYGVNNVESTAQVLIALSSLGIDIDTDERFIKNGNSIYDGIIKYQNTDGTFRRNDKSNKISGYQAFMGLVAYDRLVNNKRSFYDLKPEMDLVLKTEINSLIRDIDNINDLSKNELKQLLTRYKQVSGSERNYVYNFYKLYDQLIEKDIDINIDEDYSEELEFLENETLISTEDINRISVLNNKYTIDDYYEMVYYQEKIRNSNINEDLKLNLNEKINIVKEEQKKISQINKLISDYLLEEDEELKEEITELYNNLLKDSKKYVVDYLEVNPNIFFNTRNLIILSLVLVILSITSVFTIRVIKRKRNN